MTESIKSVKKVLIIRPTALGDVSRTVPALVTLRNAFPQARIDWMVHESFCDVVRHHPALSNVVSFPRHYFASMGYNPHALYEGVKWMFALRSRGYDLVIDLQGLLRSGFFTWITGASQRVGYANAREYGYYGYNRKFDIPTTLHSVDRMLALLAADGFAISHDMRLYVGENDRQWRESYLKEKGVGDQPYFTIAPTAKWLCKCWPMNRYANIARQLLDSGIAGRHMVVLVSPSEFSYADQFVTLVGPGRSIAVPQTRVGQMMAIIERSTLLVCNDSAPLHIGVGLDRKLVAVFGPTDPALVGPYKRDACVVQPPGVGVNLKSYRYRHMRDDQSLISEVSTEAVWAKVEEVMAGSQSHGDEPARQPIAE